MRMVTARDSGRRGGREKKKGETTAAQTMGRTRIIHEQSDFYLCKTIILNACSDGLFIQNIIKSILFTIFLLLLTIL